MIEKTFEVEAKSLEEARKRVTSQIPEGFYLVSEEVISDGKPRTVRVTGDSMEIALGQIPNNFEILEQKEVFIPERRVTTIEAFDEQAAESNAKSQAKSLLGDAAIVKSIKLVTPGRKGFLGMWKKPDQYEAEILRQAVIEVAYKTNVKLSVTLVDEEARKARQEAQRIHEERQRQTYEEQIRKMEIEEERERWEAIQDGEARINSHFNNR